MAVLTDSRFSNSIPGAMSVGADVDIYSAQALPKLAVGTKFTRQDGNEYVYAHFGAACSAGHVVCPDMNESAQIYSANAVIATSSAFQQATENSGMYPGMIGSRFVSVILGTNAVDKFAGGYLGISSGTGLGYTYRIKGNQVSSGTATVIELYDKIAVGLDATSDIVIGPSKYANLEPGLSATTQNSYPVGIAIATIATDKPFGFILKDGITTVRQSGTVTGSKAYVILSDTDAGCVETFGNGVGNESSDALALKFDLPIVGKIYQVTLSSGNMLVDVAL